MALQVAVLWGAVTVIYLRFKYDRLGAGKDLKWVLSLWYGVVPWSQGRWILKVWAFNFWMCYHVYRSRQKGKREKAAVQAETRKLEKATQHGLYRSKFDYNDSWSPMKPVIFPCRTSHTRLFPKKHSFSYSYLFVGIPVGWRGYVSTILSADLKTLPWSWGQPKTAWLNVDSNDYLARGENSHGLRGKLDDYLNSQNEKSEDYPHAYLVTAPRVLGYSFNPVSFWYLYNERKQLTAMILEVNNTFDERRMYFLRNKVAEESNQIVDDNPNQGPSIPANLSDQKPLSDDKSPGKLTATWPKDFHVSPFNSRKGDYSLSATDPFVNHLVNGNLKASCGRVNNTITLSSSKNNPKLIARVFSTSDSIDPYAFGEWQVWKFMTSWWWVGLVTFPRIVKEAGKLFFLRKLHVWFRPEVLKDSIGRNETDDEKAIASLFRDYLKSLVEDSDLPVPVQFLPGIATMPLSETFTPRSLSPTQADSPSPSSNRPNPQPTPLTLKPTTPLFYALFALFARQPSIHHFLSTTLTNPDITTTTFHTSNPDLLLRLFKNPYVSSTSPTSSKRTPSQPLDSLRWNLLHRLRKSHNPSPLDAFALRVRHMDRGKVRAYRLATLKLLVSDHVAFGVPGLIDAVLFGVRIWLCWICVQSLESLLEFLFKNSGRANGSEIVEAFLGTVGVCIWSGVGALL